MDNLGSQFLFRASNVTFLAANFASSATVPSKIPSEWKLVLLLADIGHSTRSNELLL